MIFLERPKKYGLTGGNNISYFSKDFKARGTWKNDKLIVQKIINQEVILRNSFYRPKVNNILEGLAFKFIIRTV